MPARPFRSRPQPVRSFQEQHEVWAEFLRRNVVSRRTMIKGSVGVAGAAMFSGGLLGRGGLAGTASASTELADTVSGTVAGGFVVNGRHLSFGADPRTEMWVAGQLFNLNTYNAVPSGITVYLDYGLDATYGATIEAELRELISHVPVWNGQPGSIVAARTLNADQFFVHAFVNSLDPGTEYHYQFRYTAGGGTGTTPDATFTTAPEAAVAEPFTFTAFGDEGIPGPTLDNDPSLQPESDTVVNDGAYDSDDPDNPATTGVDTTTAVIAQINAVANLVNGTPSRFNLLAGDICYANGEGDLAPIINPDGPNGDQPDEDNTPMPPANSGGWDYYDPWVWTSYFPMIEPSSASIPWMFTTGNHDAEMFAADVAADSTTIADYAPLGYGGLVKRTDLPGNGPSACPSVYSFTYGNVGIVSVDANDLSYEIQGLLGYSDGAQSTWLDGQLAAFRADPSIDWVVVFFHECAFSTCYDHSSDGGVRSVLAPLFAEYQVDLAIQGHNHVYERTNPMTYDAATNSGTSSKQAVATSAAEPAQVSPATDGTTYVGVGIAGTPRYSWSDPNETDRNFLVGGGSGTEVVGDASAGTGPYLTQADFSTPSETVDWSQARYRDYGFIALDVVPAPAGSPTTMTLRAINEQGQEFDRVVFTRTAGQSTPVPALPESPSPLLLPAAGLAVAGAAYGLRRGLGGGRRES